MPHPTALQGPTPLGDVVCVGMPTWEGDYAKSTVLLLREIARTSRVLYVDYPFSLKDAALAPLGKSPAPLGRMLGARPRLRTLEAGGATVHVLTPPPVLPTGGLKSGRAFDRATAFNGRRVGRAIRRTMRRLGMRAPVVINAFFPQLGVPLAGRLGERALVYYAYDEISAAPWTARHGPRLEAQLVDRADLVIASSGALEARFRAVHPVVHRVENGVDYALFHQAFGAWPASDTPPTIGYLGSLDRRVDVALVAEIARRRPEWRFLFVGRTDATAAPLQALQNVTLAGPQPYDSLPGWVAQMDVGTIPFVQDRLTAAIYPLKLNEYLAAGRPVVTTPFAPLGEMERAVYVAQGPDAFVGALERVLREDTPAHRRARAEAARANAWSTRAAAFADAIASMLPVRAPSDSPPAPRLQGPTLEVAA